MRRINLRHWKMVKYLRENYCYFHSAFHRLRQAKFAYGGLILSSNQNILQSQAHLKTTLAIELIKIDSKIIILLPWGRIFSQCDKELVPSWERVIWEKHWELVVPSWERARSQLVSSLTKNTASGLNCLVTQTVYLWMCTNCKHCSLLWMSASTNHWKSIQTHCCLLTK
jgi:hypothetical protein